MTLAPAAPARDAPVLTVRQPFASLIVAGAKAFETRGWPPPPELIGRRLVIHAGLNPVDPRDLDAAGAALIAAALGARYHATGALVGDAVLEGAYRSGSWPGPSRREVVLDRAVSGSPPLHVAQADPFGGDGAGRWLWRLSHPRRYPTPIPARGHKKIWTWRRPPPPAAGALF